MAACLDKFDQSDTLHNGNANSLCLSWRSFVTSRPWLDQHEARAGQSVAGAPARWKAAESRSTVSRSTH